MKLTYFPGCTLKTHASHLEAPALASMKALGYELVELPRWNCCGVVQPLAEDDVMGLLAPARLLIRAQQTGRKQLLTLCSMCYNTLARTNLLLARDREKLDTINRFMDEEPDYTGEIEVVHVLSFLHREQGWNRLRSMVKKPLSHLKPAAYYGCKLQRPADVGIEPPGRYELLRGFLKCLGARVVRFSAADLCCGSYQIMGHPDAANRVSGEILNRARREGAEALVLSCPLCEYNLSQAAARQNGSEPEMPLYYFTELLAAALGVDRK